jgi:hypothetical protein
MAEPSSFTSRLLQQAIQPAARVPFRPTMQPTAQPAAPAALTPQQEQLQRFNRAYYAYLANPDMPLSPEESSGSMRGDQQALARARYARMLDAGRSAVAERAAAQGRSLQTGADGMPVYGDAPATPLVQESPGGVRVAYRNGMPVGFSTPTPPASRPVTPTALMPQEAEAVRQEATRLAADQSAARMRAAQILRAAGATAPAVAAAEGAPVVAPAQAIVQPTSAAPAGLVEQPEPVLEEEMVALEEQFQQEPEQAEKDAEQARTEDYVTQRAALLRKFNQAVRNGQRAVAAAVQQQITALDRANPQPVRRAPPPAQERPVLQNNFDTFAQVLRGR